MRTVLSPMNDVSYWDDVKSLDHELPYDWKSIIQIEWQTYEQDIISYCGSDTCFLNERDIYYAEKRKI